MKRRAISLIELLVVLGIIGLLTALLIPAVQHARESSRRLACTNNLHQIGIALQQYQSDHGTFPASMLVSSSLALAGPWNQHVVLLPYLGQRQAFNALNINLRSSDVANTTVTFMSLAIYLCPSDSAPGRSGFGFTNYVACIGSGRWPGGFDAICDGNSVSDGVFAGWGIRPQEITDGLSRTAAFSEQVHASASQLSAQTVSDPKQGFTFCFFPSPPTQSNLFALCDSGGAAAHHLEPAGTPWFVAVRYTHLDTPNKRSCYAGNMGDGFSPITASSRHSGGVNLLLCDGHVRFISQSIDVETWRAIGSRNGNEPIDDGF